MADFDLDGDRDDVDSNLGTLSLALNHGAGTFPTYFEMITTNGCAKVAGDFTSDGKPDLVVLNPTNVPIFSLHVNSARRPRIGCSRDR